ncbi:hypothetical protein TGRUB_320592 [Toxoplasma gondii RUB]|uniref:RAP domain-containing protein n=1 Tax=Toxoplasma gondii RUB TaxID=935652 RepID=A0A086LQ86_TOXGO|nr:hypothetical protein TGRUB_320592 [Toxoplasma gondii RUB]
MAPLRAPAGQARPVWVTLEKRLPHKHGSRCSRSNRETAGASSLGILAESDRRHLNRGQSSRYLGVSGTPPPRPVPEVVQLPPPRFRLGAAARPPDLGGSSWNHKMTVSASTFSWGSRSVLSHNAAFLRAQGRRFFGFLCTKKVEKHLKLHIHPNNMGPSDISNLVRLAANKKINDGALWTAITRRVQFLKPVLSPKAIALISNGFARAQRRDFELFISLAEQSAQRLEHFESHDAALFLNALARLDLHYPRLMEHFANHLLQNDSQLVYEEQHLALIVNAYAKLTSPGSFPALFAALGRRIERQAAEFTPQGLANVINGYYRLGHRDDALMAALAPAVLRQTGQLEAQHVANILQGFAWHKNLVLPVAGACKHKITRHDEVLRSLATLLPRLQQRLGPVEVAACASAFATAALEDRAAVKAISDVVTERHESFRPDQLALTLYSLSKLKHMPPDLLQRLTPAISRQLDKFDAQSRVMLLHACSRARLPDRALFESLSERLAPGIVPSMPPQAVVMTLHALASVGLRAPLTEALLDRLATNSDSENLPDICVVGESETSRVRLGEGRVDARTRSPASDDDQGPCTGVGSRCGLGDSAGSDRNSKSAAGVSQPGVSPGDESREVAQMNISALETPGLPCAFPSSSTLERHGEASPQQSRVERNGFPIAYAASVMMSLLKLDAGDRVDLLQNICDAVCQAPVGTLTPQQLANISHCLAHFASSPNSHIASFSSDESAESRKRFLPPPLALDVVVAHALSQLQQFSPQLLGSLSLSLASLCRHLPAVRDSTEKWCAAVDRDRLPLALEKCSPQVVTTFLAASATLERPPPPEALQFFVRKLTGSLHRLNAAAFLQLLISATKLLEIVVAKEVLSRRGVLPAFDGSPLSSALDSPSRETFQVQEAILTDLFVALQEQLLSRVSCVDVPTLFASAQIVASVPPATFRELARRSGNAAPAWGPTSGSSSSVESAQVTSLWPASLRYVLPFDLLTPDSQRFLETHAADQPPPCADGDTLLEHWRQRIRQATAVGRTETPGVSGLPHTLLSVGDSEGGALCEAARRAGAGQANPGGNGPLSSQRGGDLSLRSGRREPEVNAAEDASRQISEPDLVASQVSRFPEGRAEGGATGRDASVQTTETLPREKQVSSAVEGMSKAADFLVAEQKRWRVKSEKDTSSACGGASATPREIVGRLLRYSSTKQRLIAQTARECENPELPAGACTPGNGTHAVVGSEAAIGFVSTIAATLVSLIRRQGDLFHPLLLAASTRAAGEANVQDPLFYAMAVSRLSSLELNSASVFALPAALEERRKVDLEGKASGSSHPDQRAALSPPALVDFFEGLAAAAYKLTGEEAALRGLLWPSLDGVANNPSLAARILSALRRLDALEDRLLLRVLERQVLLLKRRLAGVRSACLEASVRRRSEGRPSVSPSHLETLSLSLEPWILVFSTPVFTPAAAKHLAQVSWATALRRGQLPDQVHSHRRDEAESSLTEFVSEAAEEGGKSGVESEARRSQSSNSTVPFAGVAYLWGMDFLSALLTWTHRGGEEGAVDVVPDRKGSGGQEGKRVYGGSAVSERDRELGAGVDRDVPRTLASSFPSSPDAESPKASSFSLDNSSDSLSYHPSSTRPLEFERTPESPPSSPAWPAALEASQRGSRVSPRCSVRILLPVSAVADAVRALAALPASSVSPLTFQGASACAAFLSSPSFCVPSSGTSSEIEGSRLSAMCTGLRALGQLLALPSVQRWTPQSRTEPHDHGGRSACGGGEEVESGFASLESERDADLVSLVRAVLRASSNEAENRLEETAPSREDAGAARTCQVPLHLRLLDCLCASPPFSLSQLRRESRETDTLATAPQVGDHPRDGEVRSDQKHQDQEQSRSSFGSAGAALGSVSADLGEAAWSRSQQAGVRTLIAAGDKLLAKAEELFRLSTGPHRTLKLTDAVSLAFWCCMRLLTFSNGENHGAHPAPNRQDLRCEVTRSRGDTAEVERTCQRVLVKAMLAVDAAVDRRRTTRRTTQTLSPQEKERLTLMIRGEDRRLLMIVHSFLRLDASELHDELPPHVRSVLEAISSSGASRHQ